MNNFKTVLTFEWRRFLERRQLLFITLFTVIALYFVQTGINNYKNILENNKEAAAHERKKAGDINRYETYASLGVNLRLNPPPASIFFDNSGSFKELSGKVNGLHAIDIMVHLKGRRAFQEGQWFHASFSGWFLFAATLLMLFYGLDSFKDKSFCMTAASLSGHRSYFGFTLTARLSVAGCLSAIIMSLGVILALLNGITFNASDFRYLGIFYVVWMLVASFFFGLGALTGLQRPRLGAGTVALMVWMLMVFILPMVIDHISSYSAASIPSNIASDKQKWNAINKIETNFEKKHGDLNRVIASGNDARKLLERAYADEYQGVQKIEAAIERWMKNGLNTHHALSSLAPTAFMLNSAGEFSGKGLANLIEFFRFSRDFKRRFFFYFFKKKYPNLTSAAIDKIPESFVKNSENIYQSHSLKPGYFTAGLVLSLLYAATLFYLSSRSYYRMLYGTARKGRQEKSQIRLRLHKNRYSVVTISGDQVVQLLYSTFSGHYRAAAGAENPVRLTIDEWEIPGRDISFSGRFHYICPPESLPGTVSVDALTKFFAGLMRLSPENKKALSHCIAGFADPGVMVEKLDKETKSRILMELSAFKTSGLSIYHDIVTGLSRNAAIRLAEIMNAKTAKGNMSLYLTRDGMIKNRSRKNGFYLFEDDIWQAQLKGYAGSTGFTGA